MKRESCIIIGAGIGGLAACLALLRAGFDVRVYEQAPMLGEVGAGLTLSRGALQCCAHLGIAEAVRPYLAPAAGFAFLHFHSGERLPAPAPVPLKPGEEAHDGHIYRPDLHAVLAEAVHAYGDDRIVLGRRLTQVTSLKGGARAHFADGTTEDAGVLIGADGARSALRRAVFGDGPPAFTGKIAYRFMLPRDEAGDFETVGGPACLFVGHGRVFNRYLVSRGRLLNCVGLLKSADPAEDGWNRPATSDEMLAAFADFHPTVQSLIARAPVGSLIKWGIFARPPRDRWVEGRVALLGDAAHPMQPFLGLGAAMAIEDATILGRAFATQPTPEAALCFYAERRIARANAVMALSQQQGEIFDVTDPADFPPRRAPSHDAALGGFDPES